MGEDDPDMTTAERPRTVVAFHAHPDDEALLTAGTLARASAAGHRVVVVFATDGGGGLASPDFHPQEGLGAVRLREAEASARALGVARVAWLGYADSGSGPHPAPEREGPPPFCRVPIPDAGAALADILTTERADVLLTYDANGGYGHRDHIRVHEVGAAAAALAGTPRVLEATIPRDAIVRVIALLGRIYRFPDEFDPSTFDRAYTARAQITHRISVWRQATAKRAAMRAHASQATGGGANSAGAGAQTGDRTLAAFLRVPRPLFDLVFGREWFRDPAHPPGAPVSRDIFAGLP